MYMKHKINKEPVKFTCASTDSQRYNNLESVDRNSVYTWWHKVLVREVQRQVAKSPPWLSSHVALIQGERVYMKYMIEIKLIE